MGTDPVRDGLYGRLFDLAERVRWRMSDIPFDAIEHDKVSPGLVKFVREVALSEMTTFTASRKFLHEFVDDVDFSQWISVWFYEETRHPQVLMRWLAHFGETFDRTAVLRGRATPPFMKARIGTLTTNVISEMIASAGYSSLAEEAEEPVLQRIAVHLSADEARHASGFYSYARAFLERSADPDGDRATALKVLYLWLRDTEHVGHPVNQFHERRAQRDPDPGESARPDVRLQVRERVCRMMGSLVDVDIATPEDVFVALKRLSRGAALEGAGP